MGYEEAAAFSLDPLNQSGKFQRKLDDAYDFKKSDDSLYPIDLPCRSWRSGERKIARTFAKPLHESLATELRENPKILDDWQSSITQGEWIACYENHWKVRACRSAKERQTVLPTVLYMDGAQFTKKDSLYVFTVRFGFSRVRHLVWTVRKSILCDCGCKGWCTFSQLFQFIAWSLFCLANGINPSTRHDNLDLDYKRAEYAGLPLPFSAIVVDICGDWKEFACGWGFPSWSAKLPCFVCDLKKKDLTNPKIMGADRQDYEYDEACRVSEILVPVTAMAQLTEIRYKLETNNKTKGLTLRADVTSTSMKLKAGDRLEPSAEMVDIYKVHVLGPKDLPLTLKFWRESDPKIVMHRNPVICRELGIGYRTFSIDVLHCLHLGVYLAFNTRVVHLLIDLDAFETRETRKEDHLKVSANALTALLRHWYKGYKKELTPEARKGFTEVNYLTDKMLGQADGSKLIKLKAAESRHFMEFALFLVKCYESILRTADCDYENLLVAGQTLHDWMHVVNNNPRKLAPDVVDTLCKLQSMHNHAAHAAGVKMLPKHHQERSLLLWNLVGVNIIWAGNATDGRTIQGE